MGIKQWQGKGLGINTYFPPKESPILGEILVAIVFGHEIHIFIPTTLAVHSGVSTASLNTYNVF